MLGVVVVVVDVVVVVEDVGVVEPRTVREAVTDVLRTFAVTGTTPGSWGGTENDVENCPARLVRKLATVLPLTASVPLLPAGKDRPVAFTVSPAAADGGESSRMGPAASAGGTESAMTRVSSMTAVTLVVVKPGLIGPSF
ncbi:MAG: hypothetical protein M3P53_01055 [Actinomycetota bacterium]|nr:hypothetical protein [Actinomycetota bacterium]